jgi:hypothetical protein
MANLAIHIVGSVFIFILGIWHLVSSFKAHLKTPREYTAKLWHPLPSRCCKHLELYLQLVGILLAIAYNLSISSDFNPLIKGTTPVHHLLSLQSAAVLCVFLIVVLAVLASESNGGCRLPIPGEALFLMAASAFGIQWAMLRAGASLTSDIEGKCESLLGVTAALCCASAIVLSLRPKAFVADVALSSALCLQGLWFLQSGLSLHVESFVPQGCHRLLDVPGHAEGSTQCDLDDYKLRAFVLLDLLFVVHVIIVVIIVLTVCGLVSRVLGVRRHGGYEPLDNSNHREMVFVKAEP